MNYDSDGALDAVFAALANPHRRAIVDLVARHPASTSRVATEVGMSLTAIDRHLAVLEDAALIQRRKHGRTSYLAIRRLGLLLVQGWANRFTPAWGTDEETLDNYLAALSRDDTTTPAKETPR